MPPNELPLDYFKTQINGIHTVLQEKREDPVCAGFFGHRSRIASSRNRDIVFFSTRMSLMTLALEAPKIPLTICFGLNPGKRYASVSLLVFFMDQ
jgi:hypothetical protein